MLLPPCLVQNVVQSRKHIPFKRSNLTTIIHFTYPQLVYSDHCLLLSPYTCQLHGHVALLESKRDNHPYGKMIFLASFCFDISFIYCCWFNKLFHSSLPKMRFTKGVDHPPFSSSAHHAPYKSEDGDPDASTFPYSPSDSQATPAPDDMRNVGHAFYCQSPLATQTSRGMGRSSEAFSKGSQSERYATSLEGYIGSNNFHFSLYKWAAKGVSLTLSSHSKKTNDVGRCSRLPEVVIQADDLPSDDDDMSTSTSTGVSNNQTETHDNKVLSDAVSTITVDVLPESHSKHLSRTFTGNSGTYCPQFTFCHCLLYNSDVFLSSCKF